MAATAQPLEADRFSLLGGGRKRAACGSGAPAAPRHLLQSTSVSAGASKSPAPATPATAAAANCKQEWEELPHPRSPHLPPPQQQQLNVVRVVHLCAPKVHKAEPHEFRALVQRLTGHKTCSSSSSSFKKPTSDASLAEDGLKAPPSPAAKKIKVEASAPAAADDHGAPAGGYTSSSSSSGMSSQSSHRTSDGTPTPRAPAAAAGGAGGRGARGGRGNGRAPPSQSSTGSGGSYRYRPPRRAQLPAFEFHPAHIAFRPAADCGTSSSGSGGSTILDMDQQQQLQQQLGELLSVTVEGYANAGAQSSATPSPPPTPGPFLGHQQQQQRHHAQPHLLQHQDSFASSANSGSLCADDIDIVSPKGTGPTSPGLGPLLPIASSCLGHHHQQQHQQAQGHHHHLTEHLPVLSEYVPVLGSGGGFPFSGLGLHHHHYPAAAGASLQGLLSSAAVTSWPWMSEAAINLIAGNRHAAAAAGLLPPVPMLGDLTDDVLQVLGGFASPVDLGAAITQPQMLEQHSPASGSSVSADAFVAGCFSAVHGNSSLQHGINTLGAAALLT